MYKRFIKPLFFLFSPEKAHKLAVVILQLSCSIPGVRKLLRRHYEVQHPNLKRKLFGLEFLNPVGLAAGFDKNATSFKQIAVFGFGFIEIGTVTPRAQDGNPKPRLFRLPNDDGLINRMGFNNLGVQAAVAQLHDIPEGLIVGGNIGKNKTTPNDRAIDDYVFCFEKLYAHVDYFVVNVSSPNTPNLRELQEKEPLKKLLKTLMDLNLSNSTPKPILLKIAPDLTSEQLDDIVEIVFETKIAGIIATNTTISRGGLISDEAEIDRIGAGGLSGLPIKRRSTEVIRYLHEKSKGKIPIIGVGGVHCAQDAREKLDAGASLVQVFTGFIYEGPSIVKKINLGLIGD